VPRGEDGEGLAAWYWGDLARVQVVCKAAQPTELLWWCDADVAPGGGIRKPFDALLQEPASSGRTRSNSDCAPAGRTFEGGNRQPTSADCDCGRKETAPCGGGRARGQGGVSGGWIRPARTATIHTVVARPRINWAGRRDFVAAPASPETCAAPKHRAAAQNSLLWLPYDYGPSADL